MLQRFVGAVSVMYIWCLLVSPANGQSTNRFPVSPYGDHPIQSSVFVEPAIEMSVLERSGSPLGAVPRIELQDHQVAPLPSAIPLVEVAKADHSLLVAAGKDEGSDVVEKAKAAGKAKGGPLWFTSMSGLVMTRDRANNIELSGSTAALSDPLLMTRDAAMEWGGGFDIRFGRFFNNRQQAWEVVYWGLFADAESADATAPAGAALNTSFQFSNAF